jgi:hypothetical protein
MAQTSSRWIETFARYGYAAKGIVYCLVGLLAARAAFGSGGSTEGTRAAIETIGEQPFGRILLAATAVGLAAYVLWRFLQAVLDTEGKGNGFVGLVHRGGFLISGIAYSFLAWTSALLALGMPQGPGDSEREWTATLLSFPFGQAIVVAVGLTVIGVGLAHFRRAWRATFMRHYEHGEMSPRQRTWTRRIGRFGIAARGVTFSLIGTFFVVAGLEADPGEADGLGGALKTLARQPYGPFLLGIVAAGLFAYGFYCLTRARYRRFETDRAYGRKL